MSEFVYQISEDSDFLIHHGIKGQKWVDQNGPPYPLNPQKDYSKAEQKANAKQMIKQFHKDTKKNKLHPNLETAVFNIRNRSEIQKAIQDIEPYKKKYIKTIKSITKNSSKLTEKQIDKIQNASDEYTKIVKQFADDIVGKYGNKKLTSYQPIFLGIQQNVQNYSIKDVIEKTISGDEDYKILYNEIPTKRRHRIIIIPG